MKFWKKQPIGIEFVKHFRAHTGVIGQFVLVALIASAPLTSVNVSVNGELLLTASQDKSVKVFDVESFDMINIIQLDFIPTCVQWICTPENPRPFFCWSACPCSSCEVNSFTSGDADSGLIRLYDATGELLKTLDSLHMSPVLVMAYSSGMYRVYFVVS